MEDPDKIPPRVDLMARLICLAVGSGLAICSYYAFSSGGHGFLPWLLAFGATVTLIAGSFWAAQPTDWTSHMDALVLAWLRGTNAAQRAAVMLHRRRPNNSFKRKPLRGST